MDNLASLTAFKSREDLKQFGRESLLLFALQLKFGIEDIGSTASTSVTEGADDKKADLVYIDVETGNAVIAQTYITDSLVGKDGKPKKEAPANKASDLNAAASWLFSSPITSLPENLKSHAQELRKAIQDGSIKSIQFWYVHNLPESDNVKNELTIVEHTVNSAIKTCLPNCGDLEIQALEVGINTLEEWYTNISTPILVTEEFNIQIPGSFMENGDDWKAYVTSVPAKWLYDQFKAHKNKLFSANVREYLGSRNVDQNINSGIKQTAQDDPGHFWVYNNGITALVNSIEEKTVNGEKIINFKGISIVNGAQTVGAIGNLESQPQDKAKVQVRFITCNNVNTVYDIVRYNNSQNKITAPDFRSNDSVQRRLLAEFAKIPSIKYLPRRGGHEDIIKRSSDVLPSVTAGQALAAFHGDPGIAYHEKTHMWEDNVLYSKYFCEHTNAKHILFAYSLLKSVERKKLYLWNKSKDNSLTQTEREQLDFFRKRGSTFLMSSAIANSLELVLNKQIPHSFSLNFKANLSPEKAIEYWNPIVEAASAFTKPLIGGLSDGFKTEAIVNEAIQTFKSYINATKQVNTPIYNDFAELIN